MDPATPAPRALFREELARLTIGDTTASYLPQTQPSPVPAPTVPRVEIITQGSILDYTESWVGWKLTPERLAWVLRQADWGWPTMMYDIFENVVLADGHTRGLFEQALDEMSVDYTWLAGDDSPGSAQLAEELSELSESLDMESAIEHVALQPFWGSSYAEVAWQSRADGRQIPVEIVCVPHRRFLFDPVTFEPRLTSEANVHPGEPLERRPGSSWLRAESKRWRKATQAGLLRTAAFYCVFKRMSVRDWLIFAEKFGIPFITGHYGENASETTRAALIKAIAALGTEGRAILGPEARIEIHDQAIRGGQGADNLHAGIVSLCNAELAKLITAGTLTSDVGGPGSFALGQVHADQKHKIMVARARRAGNVFRRDLAREYVIRNGLVGKASPAFLRLRVQKLSLLTDSQVITNLAGAGVPISISQIQEKFELRAPANEADTLKPPTPTKANNADPANPKEPADPG